MFRDESYNLRIELDSKHSDVTPDMIKKMETGLNPLRELVKDFPISDLYITIIKHPRSSDYHVKLALVLTGKTLFTGERHELMYPAFERCVRKLVQKVRAYKESLEDAEERSKHEKGTYQDVQPDFGPDMDQLEKAVQAGDYNDFRVALFGYEEPVRKRVGRWLQRYPELEAEVGQSLQIRDLVEEVFLNAFEQFSDRRLDQSLSEWLESLIDPSMQEVLENPEEEKANIEFVRSLRERPE